MENSAVLSVSDQFGLGWAIAIKGRPGVPAGCLRGVKGAFPYPPVSRNRLSLRP
jgi:hypothetical protein